SVRSQKQVPGISRSLAANLRSIFHRTQFRRTRANRQFLLVLFGHRRAGVPIGVEGEDEPIIVVDERWLNFVLHVGRRAIDLRTLVANLDRLSFLIFSLKGDLTGLGLPGPGAGKIELRAGKVDVKGIADGVNLSPRTTPVGLGELLDNRWTGLCLGRAGQETHRQKEPKDGRGPGRVLHRGSPQK